MLSSLLSINAQMGRKKKIWCGNHLNRNYTFDICTVRKVDDKMLCAPRCVIHLCLCTPMTVCLCV